MLTNSANNPGDILGLQSYRPQVQMAQSDTSISKQTSNPFHVGSLQPQLWMLPNQFEVGDLQSENDPPSVPSHHNPFDINHLPARVQELNQGKAAEFSAQWQTNPFLVGKLAVGDPVPGVPDQDVTIV